MSATLVGHFVHRSTEWHAARRRALGGSEVAAALGLSTWTSPFELWHRKRGTLPEHEPSQSMRWGTLLEDVVLGEWWRRHGEGRWSTRNGTWLRDGWKVANPDLLIYPEPGTPPTALVEAKTADKYDAWQWGPDGSDEPDAIPVHYRVQVLWYGHVLGVTDLQLAVLIGGNDDRTYRVPWDEAEVNLIVERAGAFWASILDGTEPDLDSSMGTYEAVRAQHPDIDMGAEVELSAELVSEWRLCREYAKRWQADLTLAKAHVIKAMGDARYGLLGGEKVAIRQANGDGTPYPKLLPPRKVKT